MTSKVALLLVLCIAVASAKPSGIFGFDFLSNNQATNNNEDPFSGLHNLARGFVNGAAGLGKFAVDSMAGFAHGVVKVSESVFRIAFGHVLSPQGAFVPSNSELTKQCNSQACEARCPGFIFTCVQQNLDVCAYCPMMTPPVQVVRECNQDACLSVCPGFSVECVTANPQVCHNCPSVGIHGVITETTH